MIVAPRPMLAHDPSVESRGVHPGQIAGHVSFEPGRTMKSYRPGGGVVTQSAHVSSRKSVAFERQRKSENGDARARRRLRARRCVHRQAVFGVERDAGREREDPEAGRARLRDEDVDALVEERSIAAELVDEKAAEESSAPRASAARPCRRWRQTRHRARCRDEHPRRADATRKCKVREIDRAKIELAHAAGALDDDDVEARGQRCIGVVDRRAQAVGVCVVARAPTASSTRGRARRPGSSRCRSA